MKVFLNGKFIPLDKAKVSVLDRGFLYGDGAFETMRAYAGKVFMLRAHVERLFGALETLKIKSPYSKNTLAFFVDKTVRQNALKDAYVKLIVTRGVGGFGFDIPKKNEPTALIYASPLEIIPDRFYKKGISVNFASAAKNKNSYTTGLKTLNYIDNIMARSRARDMGYYETVFINTRGFITEAAASNIFIIKNGAIFTPPEKAGLLAGITREAVIVIVKRCFGNRVFEKNLRKKDLSGADEIFLTNSILEIVPVVKLEKKMIGRGKPGAFTNLLRILYKLNAPSSRP